MRSFLFLLLFPPVFAVFLGCRNRAPAADELSSYIRAKDLYLDKRDQEALDLLEGRKGLKDFPPALFLMGKIYYLSRRNQEAEVRWRGLLRIRPSHQETRKWLARLLIDQGRSQEAEEVLAPALEDDPEDPELLILTAKARLRREDTAGAVEYFSKARAALERLAEGPLELSEIYRAFGMPRRAAEELDLAAALLGAESSLVRGTRELGRRLREEGP